MVPSYGSASQKAEEIQNGKLRLTSTCQDFLLQDSRIFVHFKHELHHHVLTSRLFSGHKTTIQDADFCCGKKKRWVFLSILETTFRPIGRISEQNCSGQNQPVSTKHLFPPPLAIFKKHHRLLHAECDSEMLPRSSEDLRAARRCSRTAAGIACCPDARYARGTQTSVGQKA